MNRYVPDLVAQCAQSAPTRIAIVEGRNEVTYGALIAASDAVRERLRVHCVSRDVVVAVCMPRSAAAIAAALAVMGVGGAYLPLDPSQPRDRLRAILVDAGARVFVGAPALYDGLTDIVPHYVAPVAPPAYDEPRDGARDAASDSPEYDLSADDLAYVIYTSGSSGHPKGVEISHASLDNLLDWHRAAFGVTAEDRASHLAEVGFDAAVWEVWPYLTAGATIVIGDALVAKDPEALATWLCENEITLAYASAPIAERLMRAAWPKTVALRMLLTGADRLHTPPPVTLPFAVVNNYGPTEATVVATSGRIFAAADGAAAERFPTIGSPIAGARVYVVDADGRLVAPGSEGELWIGGMGIARGYRRAAAGTAGAFAPDPFDAAPGARIFKSGDRGRYLPSGELEFLGRDDEQVKIRGYRIEPAEIERALCDHPAIVAAAVVAQNANDAHAQTNGARATNGAASLQSPQKRLLAYLVAPDGAPEPRELRALLARKLPAYMVPSTFLRVAALPLTDNGKVDRAALRMQQRGEVLADPPDDAPLTVTEERIAAIVAPLLKLERIGVRDNIFMLGGHSLLGTQIIARIRDAFGVRLGLRLLFESPTVAALAAEVDRVVVPARSEAAALGVAAETA